MGNKLELFIGPCVLESEGLALEIAGRVKSDLEQFSSDIIFNFKGSFDKANRSSIDSYRGPGINEGLKILERVKKEYGLPLITDFHDPSQADEVASVVDTLQVPAFLCRQTDMIVSGAKACLKYSGRLNIKKGQFLAPRDTEQIIKKATSILKHEQVMITERGTSFGYNNLIVDMSSFQTIKEFGVRVVHDATHCVQMPGGLGKITGGKREQILTLAKAAIAAGADAIFMEVHPTPEKALSDSTTSMHLDKVVETIELLLKYYKVER